MYSEARQSHVAGDGILDVLRFSDKWDAPGVQAYCIDYLGRSITRKELHPVLAFSIGRKFNQKPWLKDALNNIQLTPVSTWIENPTILSWMAPHDLIVILRLREYTYLSRLDLVCFRPPAVHTSSCRNMQECSFHWDLAWALGVVPRIAHKTFNLNHMFGFVMDLKVDNMGEGCTKLSKDAALDSGKFYTDIRGVNKALNLI